VLERRSRQDPATDFKTAAEFREALENGLTGRRPLVRNFYRTTRRNHRADADAAIAGGVAAVGTGSIQHDEEAPSATVPKPPTERSRCVAASGNAGVLVVLLIIGGGVLASSRPASATAVLAPDGAQPQADSATAGDVSPSSTPEVEVGFRYSQRHRQHHLHNQTTAEPPSTQEHRRLHPRADAEASSGGLGAPPQPTPAGRAGGAPVHLRQR